jgi:hypothetical protein
VNILKEVTTEWVTEREAGKITCHTRMIGGVLCRWWGDGPPPPGARALTDLGEMERFRAALQEIADHSVCCDARHVAEGALNVRTDGGCTPIVPDDSPWSKGEPVTADLENGAPSGKSIDAVVRQSSRERLETAIGCIRNARVRLQIRRIFEAEIPNASVFWDEDEREVELIANDWEIIIRERDGPLVPSAPQT